MSDFESTAPSAHTAAAAASLHPTWGGKSIESVQPQARQPYKSWRKKYRKMRAHFDAVLEENKRVYRDEQKLEAIAKRLREELDGLLDICLDINENPSLAPSLRFHVRPAPRRPPPIDTASNISPEEANHRVSEYKTAVSLGQIPHVDLFVVRDHLEHQLAAQEVEHLDTLAASTPHPNTVAGPQGVPDWAQGANPPGFMTVDQESTYLARLDAQTDPYTLTSTSTTTPAKAGAEEADRHFADLTPREQERQIELQNPQSQHNWLRTHPRNNQPMGAIVDVDDTESLASHEPKPPRKRGPNKNLAKQVGDRAVERAREGPPGSPSASLAGDEEELGGGSEEAHLLQLQQQQQQQLGSGRKRARDPDGAYRVKGGKAGGVVRGKRKRSGEEGGAGGTPGSGKRARMEGLGE